MDFEIPKLDTLPSLKLARTLNELSVIETFDFKANMRWGRPFGMLFTAIAIRQFRCKYMEQKFHIECDENKEGISYAAHMGFFKTISDLLKIGKEPGEAEGNNNYIPITKLDFSQLYRDGRCKDNHIYTFGTIIENESARLAKLLSRDNKEMHRLMTYLIREILRNIAEHADVSDVWICGQYWANHQAEVAIIDEGIGIQRSLRRNPLYRQYIKDDETGLQYAVKPGISQTFGVKTEAYDEDDEWNNSGFGLYMVKELCRKLDGNFCIASGEKYLSSDVDNDIKIGDTHFKGTAVRIQISTKALVNSDKIIQEVMHEGESLARLEKNAFKKASKPSRGLMN